LPRSRQVLLGKERLEKTALAENQWHIYSNNRATNWRLKSFCNTTNSREESRMADLQLDIAFWNYDRTRTLVDGTVKIEGVAATYHSAPIVTEIFQGMIKERKFDVSELGMTYFLRTFEGGESPFVAIPVFPNEDLNCVGAGGRRQRSIDAESGASGRHYCLSERRDA
jgi:hypothetical protein